MISFSSGVRRFWIIRRTGVPRRIPASNWSLANLPARPSRWIGGFTFRPPVPSIVADSLPDRHARKADSFSHCAILREHVAYVQNHLM